MKAVLMAGIALGGLPVATAAVAAQVAREAALMSIDVHTIEGGKLSRSYHVEDWMSAVRQLAAQCGPQ